MKLEDLLPQGPAAPNLAPSRPSRAVAILVGGGLALMTSLSSVCSRKAPATAGSLRGPVVIYLIDTLRPDRMSAYSAAASDDLLHQLKALGYLTGATTGDALRLPSQIVGAP